jgi:uncharacterized protein with PIN domain
VREKGYLMENHNVHNINQYQSAICTYCDGPLSRTMEGEPGERVQVKTCTCCGAEFGPAWPEHQWTEPDSEPDYLWVLHAPIQAVRTAGAL